VERIVRGLCSNFDHHAETCNLFFISGHSQIYLNKSHASEGFTGG
jgi:hypothetical protein